MTHHIWKQHVPAPVFDTNPGFIELYWKAWELAWDHVRERPGLPQSPYMDEGLWDDTIWIWDTCFMTLFTRYAPAVFPGLESLRNFYIPLHTQLHPPGQLPLRIQHLDNPPLFAWAEWESFRLSGDTEHVRELILEDRFLQKHFDWFDRLEPGQKLPNRQSAEVALRKTEHGYHWSGIASGMDNTPRGRGRYSDILWLDALAQQGLSALCISRLAEAIDAVEVAETWRSTYENIRDVVNNVYWDGTDGIYYDVDAESLKPVRVKTPAAFWPMLAQMCSPKQGKALANHVRNPESLGGFPPLPSVSRSDPDYVTTGMYWRGGIWLPTAYVVIKALEQYGYHELANEMSHRLLEHMLKTYLEYEPHTIWEAYAPEEARPATAKDDRQIVARDFCGWSALGPISLFIESVLGFHEIEARNAQIKWRMFYKERHGITNLHFGNTVTDIVTDGRGGLVVKSNEPYTLVINGAPLNVPVGENRLSIPGGGRTSRCREQRRRRP